MNNNIRLPCHSIFKVIPLTFKILWAITMLLSAIKYSWEEICNIVQVDFGVLRRGVSIKHYLDQNAMSIILPAGKS